MRNVECDCVFQREIEGARLWRISAYSTRFVASYRHPSTSYKTMHIAFQSPEIPTICSVNSDSTPASAYTKSFGPVVVNIPLVKRPIVETCEATDAEGRRYFEVQGKVE